MYYENIHHPTIFLISSIVVGGMIFLMWYFGDDGDNGQGYA